MKGAGSVNCKMTFKGLVGAWLNVQFVFYKMVCNVEEFVSVWGIDDTLCKVTGDNFVLNV